MAGVQRTGPVPIEIANQDTRERRAPQPRLVAADEEEPTLASYLETVNQARWLILVATLLAVTGAGLYVFFATPIYQSDTLVQLEEKKGTLSGLDDLSNMFSSPSPAETEIEILRSRTLVGSVVDELHLYVLAEPRYFPMVGKGIARRRASDGPASPVLDLASFAWGGERIAVDRIEVPRRWEGKRLTLVARGAGRYELLDPNGSLIASGEAGKALAAGELGLFVSDLVAREGTQFWVARLPRTQVIEELQGDLVIAEKGKKTGILRVGLEAPAPERLAAVLDAIARTYLRQNVERKSAEAEKTLRFINGQLPQLRQSVDVAEQALSTYRAMNGSVDVSLETKGALDRAVDVEKELTGLELQVSEAKLRFTDSHPAMITARAKIARLSVERDEINARIKRLPAAELQSARLIRDMKVANELYVLLLNKAQELQVVKSGTIGNVRILDAALVPEAPVSPRSAATLALAALAGAVLGAIAAFGRKALDQGVDDPELIERESGLPVYATVPHSAEQADLSRGLGKKGSADSAVLAVVQPNALAIEALRSLRTSLQFALAEARNNIVAISGPSPGIGKSFVCVNLAHVQADNGMRVLLVDADLRKGRLHHYLGCEKMPGLSDLIRGTATEKDAIRKTSENLHFLAMGDRPPNPSELLSSKHFEELMARASREYDLVLIDTPPILAVTDAALAGRTAGTNLLVLRAGQHPVREIALAVKRMAQNGVVPHALILNDVMPKAGGYAYSKYGYHYHYKYT